MSKARTPYTAPEAPLIPNIKRFDMIVKNLVWYATKKYLAIPLSRVSLQVSERKGGRHMAIEAHIRELSDKHAKLDLAIQNEMKSLASSDAQIAALKRQKLKLKEELEKLRRQH
jgi:hypothetical protein